MTSGDVYPRVWRTGRSGAGSGAEKQQDLTVIDVTVVVVVAAVVNEVVFIITVVV